MKENYYILREEGKAKIEKEKKEAEDFREAQKPEYEKWLKKRKK